MTIHAGDVAMNDLLEVAVEQGASDLHLAVGLPPVLRLHGRLQPLDVEVLRAEDTTRLMKAITPEDHQRRLQEGAALEDLTVARPAAGAKAATAKARAKTRVAGTAR